MAFANSSPMAVSNFGINRLAYNFFREHDQKSAIEFEFISKAESAHLAMALDATYFPFRAEMIIKYIQMRQRLL